MVVGAGVVGAGRVVVGAGVVGAGRVGITGNTAAASVKIVGITEYPSGIGILRAFFHRSSVKSDILPLYMASSRVSDNIHDIHVSFTLNSVR